MQPSNAKRTKGRCVTCFGKTRRGIPRLNTRGENSHNWTGGRRLDHDGYMRVNIHPGEPFFCMANKGQRTIKEHRLVMAQHLGRPLERWEVVHHINGNRTDNEITNLALLPGQNTHVVVTCLQQEVLELRERVKQLEMELRLSHLKTHSEVKDASL
jgi:hypothetical protein